MKSLALEQLSLIASAPDGVKKLRELILQLAVLGKLASQDANDDPASKWLERSKQVAGREHGENEHRTPVNSTCPAEFHQPFTLRSSWQWCRFADILDFQGGGQPPKSSFSDTNLPDYVRLLQIRDLGDNPHPVYVKRTSNLKYCSDSDIMVGRYGASVGKVFWGQDGAYNVALVRIIDKHEVFNAQYLYYLLNSPLGQSLFSGISRSAQDGFNKKDIADKLLPIPPLSEQHSIVTKVDELMALCDKLEAQQNDSEAAHSLLVKTLLDTLTQTQDADDSAASWARIKENFHTLFTTEESVDILKQTLLQLAVMGKLVPQDPNDEPASMALRRILSECRPSEAKSRRAAFGAEAKIEGVFEIPQSWTWTKLSDISYVGTGSTPSRGHPEFYRGSVPWVTSGLTGASFISETDESITEEAVRAARLKIYPRHSLVLAMYGQGKTRGQISELLIEATINQACAAIVLQKTAIEYRRYVKIFFEHAYERIRTLSAGGAQPNLNVEKVKMTLIPLPPIAEQHRIVAKVDELKALCDKLKLDIQASRRLQEQVSSVMLQNAVGGESEPASDSRKQGVLSRA